jgi:hypothetical protein
LPGQELNIRIGDNDGLFPPLLLLKTSSLDIIDYGDQFLCEAEQYFKRIS